MTSPKLTATAELPIHLPISGRPIRPIEATLRTGSVVDVVPNPTPGVYPSSLVRLSNGDETVPAIFKPSHKSAIQKYWAEVLAYEVSERLEFSMVPPTVVRKIDGAIGSLQLFRENIKPERQSGTVYPYSRLGDRTTFASQYDLLYGAGNVPIAEILKAKLFAYVVDKQDCNTIRNWLFTEDQKIVSIDHGSCFDLWEHEPKRLEDATRDLHLCFIEHVHNQWTPSLSQALSDQTFFDELSERMGVDRTKRFFRRIGAVVDYFELLQKFYMGQAPR